jgi:hypothetical protein
LSYLQQAEEMQLIFVAESHASIKAVRKNIEDVTLKMQL